MGVKVKDVLRATLSRPIAFHAILGKISGSANSGLMLTQALYWRERTNDPEGWFYKTQQEWEEETCLTRWEQQTARKILEQLGLMQSQRRGNPANNGRAGLFYRVSEEAITSAIADYVEKQQSMIVEKPQHKNGEKPHLHVGKPQTLKGTETTTETTSETTGSIPPPKNGLRKSERDSWDLRRFREALAETLPQTGNPYWFAERTEREAMDLNRYRSAAFDAGITLERLQELLIPFGDPLAKKLMQEVHA